MTTRRLPPIGQNLSVLRMIKPMRRPDVLGSCRTIADVRAAARRRLPRPVFDYVDGGADDEISLAGNEEAFRRYSFTPRVLADVSAPDLAADILGRPSAMPLGLSPTGYTRMTHPSGEVAVGRAAAAAGVPYALSTMGSTSLEDLRVEVPDADLWFQLYIWKDSGLTRELVQRAADQGYRVLEVGVDTAVAGYRVRDVRNGLSIPPQITLSAAAQIATRPSYWTGVLRTPPLTFANLPLDSGGGFSVQSVNDLFDPAVTWDHVARIRELWPGRLALKGPIGPVDALRAASIGVDAVHLSNHGGRQLDRTIAPIDLVGPVREAVGEQLAILVDSGVRHGADIATALALGADAAFVGRPYLYGLAVAQQRGVAHVIDLLRTQLTRTMQLLGVSSVAQLRAQGGHLVAASR